MGGIANQQAAQQSSATNAYANTALGAQQNVLGAIITRTKPPLATLANRTALTLLSKSK